ncbi:MAG TPA: Ig-like domain repeat protein [Verrucomicrobiae bacterium]|nr:Ig-like domain repeat protein [Verrucomicrobiae bacterium]
MFYFPAKIPRNPPLIFALILLSLLFPRVGLAQSRPSLITQPVNNSALITLTRNTYPLARPEFDRGLAPASLPMNRMMLVLKRSAGQQAALDSLIAQQQDKSSPHYHQWLTPQQFGQEFGPTDSDLSTIQSWLASEGFQDVRVSNGRTYIEFSGSAAQVQSAFHTAIHHYVVNGVDHWANATDPKIPAALAPAVAGVATLHNFFKRSQLFYSGQRVPIERASNGKPEFNLGGGTHALGPGDFAVIYGVNPLYQANVTGAGRTISVVARSNVDLQDIFDFRDLFQLSGPQPNVIVNGDDPGIIAGAEQVEATLDLTWSSAIAPGAQANLIVSASTNTTDGVDLSEAYIIDNDLGDVMTESFSGCEADATQAEATQISSLAEQAAAEGITYLVSTGDSGAEGCDDPDTETTASGPVSVNILASTPYTIGVGGTVFNEGTNASSYWSTSSNSLTTAISYIPEDVWNDSCATSCGSAGPNIWAGSGGASTFFNKPVWQASVNGIPDDNARDLPDVSLTAALHDGYVLCVDESCEQGDVVLVGGTSASAPSFAGIMALVDQTQGSRQGQANYVLYRLAAAEAYSNCNGSSQTSLPSSNCVFNDITVGNNAVPGESGYGTPTAQYQSGAGYDLATGLGSVNASNLANTWSSARSEPPTVTFSVNPSGPITHGTSVNMQVGVAATPPATGVPTGDISIIGPSSTSPSSLQPFSTATLDANGNATVVTNQLPGGSVTLTAHYEGDGTFIPGDATASLTVNPETSSTSLAVSSGGPSGQPFSSGTYGTPVYFSSQVAGSSGVGTPTGVVIFQEASSGPVDGQAGLNKCGTASTTVGDSLLPVGSHTLVASYQGDPSFQASSSPPVTFSISQAATTTGFNPASGTIIADGYHTVQILVSGTGQGASPSGTVSLYSGSNQVGSALPVSSSGTAQSSATLIGSSLPFGTITLAATYSGDANYTGSNSSAATFNVVRPTSVSIQSSNPTIVQGTSVTFTATVTSSQSGPAISGNVQFTANGNPIGSAVALNNGEAQITTMSLSSGADTIAAIYTGDSNYGINSASIIENVAPAPSVQVSAAPPTIVVSSPGQSGATSVVFTGQNDFSGTIPLSSSDCTGLPSEASCSFSAGSVTLSSAKQTASVTLTISTTAASQVAPANYPSSANRIHLERFGELALVLMLFIFSICVFHSRLRRWNYVHATLLFFALAAMSACGGGGSGPTNPGTPVGTSNITVTLNTGTGSQTLQVQLTVN